MSRTLATNRVALKENYLVREGTVFEDFDTIGDWTRNSAGGTIEVDNSYFSSGLKLTSASGTNVYYDKVLSSKLPKISGAKLKLYIESLTGISNVAIYISSTTGYTAYVLKTINVAALHEGENVIHISQNEFTVSGGELWSNTMLRLRIRINASSGTPAVTFGELSFGEFSKPKFIATFDDGWDSQYTKGFAKMSPLGMKGTIYVIGSRVDTAGYMTLAQLQEVYAAGWDLGVHGDTNLTTFATQEEMEAEIDENRQFLIDNGFTRAIDHYAYPNGGYNDLAIAALTNLGFKTARTIIDTTQPHVATEPMLLTRQAMYNSTTVAAMKAFIYSAVSRGNAIIPNWHIIVDATADTTTKVLTADFNTIIDYADLSEKQGLIESVTISEWYNGLSV